MKQNISPVVAVIVIVVVVVIAGALWMKFSSGQGSGFGKAGTETSAGMPPSAGKALAEVMKNQGNRTAPSGGSGTTTPGLGGGTPNLPGQGSR